MQLWAGKGYSSPVWRQVYNFRPAKGTLPPFHGKYTIFSRQGVLFPRFEAIVRFSGETFGGDPVARNGL